MTDKDKIRKKALETFLSGRKNPGAKNTWEQPRDVVSEEEKEEMEALQAPISTKDLKIRGRKKGKVTPRQTIRIDEALWRQFLKKARSKEGKSGSEIIRRFIYKYVHG